MIGNIQILRGVAALAVVLFHLPTFGGRLDLPGAPDAFLRNLLASGAAGVDLFFVISGFIMAHVYARRPDGPGLFLLRRGLRIVPLYWMVTLAWWGRWRWDRRISANTTCRCRIWRPRWASSRRWRVSTSPSSCRAGRWNTRCCSTCCSRWRAGC